MGCRKASADGDEAAGDDSASASGAAAAAAPKPTSEILGTLSAAGERYQQAAGVGRNDDSSRPGTAYSQPGGQRQDTPSGRSKVLANRKGHMAVADRYQPAGSPMSWVGRLVPVSSPYRLPSLYNQIMSACYVNQIADCSLFKHR